MRKVLLLCTALLCLSLWGIAQTDRAAAQANTSGQTAGAPAPNSTTSGNPAMTVDGCLNGSAGDYTLTDKASGTTYKLEGNTAKMAAHVGHEVQVTGTASGSGSSASSAANATASGNMSGMGGSQALTVSSFKHLAGSCPASR